MSAESAWPEPPPLPRPPDWSNVSQNIWLANTPPAGSGRALKHDLVAQTKRLIEAVAMLDPGSSDPEQLGELVAQARRLAEAVEQLPDLRAQGGPAMAGGDDSTLMERSGISGRSNPLASPLHLWADGDKTRGWAVWTDAYEGPPGCLHGGFVASAFDDLLGFAQMASGRAGYTGRLTVKMRRPTPLNVRVDYEAGVDRVDGRKILVTGSARVDDMLVAEAECLFVAPRHPTPQPGPASPRHPV
jgi:acyl-coenzyme A thioesterase PaaI-like protein